MVIDDKSAHSTNKVAGAGGGNHDCGGSGGWKDNLV
jgi:hypothetical protein